MIPFILFKLTNRTYGIPFNEIDEIQNGRKGTPLPFSEPWHEGMITIRGELYAVLNVAKKLGLTHNQQAEQGKIILLRSYKAVLLVDELEDTITVEDEMLDPNEEQNALLRHIFPTVIRRTADAEPIPVLNVDAFIASTKA